MRPAMPPVAGNRTFGRVIVTVALVGGLLGGLVALRAGKRQAAERKARFMAPASAEPAPAAGDRTPP